MKCSKYEQSVSQHNLFQRGHCKDDNVLYAVWGRCNERVNTLSVPNLKAQIAEQIANRCYNDASCPKPM